LFSFSMYHLFLLWDQKSFLTLSFQITCFFMVSFRTHVSQVYVTEGRVKVPQPYFRKNRYSQKQVNQALNPQMTKRPSKKTILIVF
jgi:hypothetical protein